MTWQPTPTSGVVRRTLTFHPDDRGSFAEIWRASWTDDVPGADGPMMRQANLSRSQARVLRGIHVHEHQADLWVVVEGRAFIGLVDLRGPLAGNGAATVQTIEAQPGDAVFLPEGVAHGFYAREALTLLYFVTNEYDGSDEHGFAWDDPTAAVPWPDGAPILSPRDAAAPSLRELVERLRAQR